MKTRINMVALLASLSQRGIAVVLTTHNLHGVAAHRTIDETRIRVSSTRDGLKPLQFQVQLETGGIPTDAHQWRGVVDIGEQVADSVVSPQRLVGRQAVPTATGTFETRECGRNLRFLR